ncbi:hypothetical protein K439DRAFT_1623364 [Ramaria rubella]|nr:hypothetical protein K439DRAFT_1623364 [Ramaria rubella]
MLLQHCGVGGRECVEYTGGAGRVTAPSVATVEPGTVRCVTTLSMVARSSLLALSSSLKGVAPTWQGVTLMSQSTLVVACVAAICCLRHPCAAVATLPSGRVVLTKCKTSAMVVVVVVGGGGAAVTSVVGPLPVVVVDGKGWWWGGCGWRWGGRCVAMGATWMGLRWTAVVPWSWALCGDDKSREHGIGR